MERTRETVEAEIQALQEELSTLEDGQPQEGQPQEGQPQEGGSFSDLVESHITSGDPETDTREADVSETGASEIDASETEGSDPAVIEGNDTQAYHSDTEAVELSDEEVIKQFKVTYGSDFDPDSSSDRERLDMIREYMEKSDTSEMSPSQIALSIHRMGN